MKRELEYLLILVVTLYATVINAHDKVVVIPLYGSGGSGGNVTNPAPVGKSGQSICTYYDGANWQLDATCTNGTRPPGQDGELKSGVAWPNPRFTDNSDGTVTDNLTGLIWLQNAGCLTFYSGDPSSNTYRPWSDALTSVSNLANGYCGLTDGSSAGDWHLPSRHEFFSLIDDNFTNPSLSNASGTAQYTYGDAFISVQNSTYWTSATLPDSISSAFTVTMANGSIGTRLKIGNGQVWAVKSY